MNKPSLLEFVNVKNKRPERSDLIMTMGVVGITPDSYQDNPSFSA